MCIWLMAHSAVATSSAMPTPLPLTPEQLAAIEKLEQLAAEKLAAMPSKAGDFHNTDRQMLANVPIWAKHVKEDHTNRYTQHTVESNLQNLRRVARRFGFKLKD